jgi:hypothetical protein
MAVDCCLDLGHIEKFCGGVNAPGLDRQLQVMCGEHVKSIPDAVKHEVGNIGLRPYAAAIVANPSATPPILASPAVTKGEAFTWNFAKEDQSFESDQDDNGLWKTKVKIFVPKLEAVKSDVFNNATGDDKIVVVKDRNGKKRLIGSTSEGCSIKVKEQTNPKNGYVIEMDWESSHSPYFFTGTIA